MPCRSLIDTENWNEYIYIYIYILHQFNTYVAPASSMLVVSVTYPPVFMLSLLRYRNNSKQYFMYSIPVILFNLSLFSFLWRSKWNDQFWNAWSYCKCVAVSPLIHCGLVTSYYVMDRAQHWFHLWLGAVIAGTNVHVSSITSVGHYL